MQLRVVQMQIEAERVVSLQLSHPLGDELPSWAPGAHIDVALPSGMVRQYSLCGDPADRDVYRIGVLKDPNGRGGSRQVHEEVRVGDLLEISGPRNHFELIPAQRYVFIAGGIGITPLLPMVEAVARSGLPWSLFYMGRTRSAMGFVRRLEAFGDRVAILPDDVAHGVTLAQIVDGARSDAHVYCCGPGGLIEAVEHACETAGLFGRCHVERFAPPAAAPSDDEDTPFTAVIASTGQRVPVPVGKSLLQCLLDHGLDVLYSCEEGMCGSCEVKVREGVPLHRDCVLNDNERRSGDRMMVCVSRARSDTLVLDL